MTGHRLTNDLPNTLRSSTNEQIGTVENVETRPFRQDRPPEPSSNPVPARVCRLSPTSATELHLGVSPCRESRVDRFDAAFSERLVDGRSYPAATLRREQRVPARLCAKGGGHRSGGTAASTGGAADSG